MINDHHQLFIDYWMNWLFIYLLIELINSWNWLIDPLMQEYLRAQKYHSAVVLFARLDFRVNDYSVNRLMINDYHKLFIDYWMNWLFIYLLN